MTPDCPEGVQMGEVRMSEALTLQGLLNEMRGILTRIDDAKARSLFINGEVTWLRAELEEVARELLDLLTPEGDDGNE